MSFEQYTVVTGDIKASRKMRQMQRYEWQLFLKSTIIQLNEQFHDLIDVPFMITKGDEFQGVLKRLSDVNTIICNFEQMIFPLQLRFGVGVGTIQKMGSKISIEMDGPAFHRAAAALARAKQHRRVVWIETDDSHFDLIINTLYQLIYAIKSRWSDLNFKRYWMYKELGTYEKVARNEGVSTQAVWDSLQNASAMDVIEAEHTLDHVFAQRLLMLRQQAKAMTDRSDSWTE